ncbi:MAG: SCO family protein [Gammaproteobacteria bacterium]|nr:MAG: SCO family protein [Gammaproteobacteria bacterium]
MAGHDPGAEHMAGGIDRKAALAYSQAAIGHPLGDYRLIDSDGNPVQLADFRGRPLILSLVYTSCHHVCPMLTTHLKGVVEMARDLFGEEGFTVATIGFDTPVDTPRRMAEFAHARGIDDPGWHFLSADAETIRRLAADTGFLYQPSPRGFDHLAQITLVDARGVVHQQVYGADFEPPRLIEPLKELVYGTPSRATEPSGWLNRVRLFCTLYDPASGRYRFDYSIFIGILVGLMSLGAIAVFIFRSWRETRGSA